MAVVLDYAHFIAPQGDPIYVADLSQTLIQIQDWAANPEVTSSFVATVLITENLADLNRSLVETPYSAKIRIPLPAAEDIRAFVEDLVPDVAEFAKASEVTRDVLADKLVGPLARLRPHPREARPHERRADHRAPTSRG